MTDAMNKALAVKEISFVRRTSARALLTLAVALRRTARRLEGGHPGAGYSPAVTGASAPRPDHEQPLRTRVTADPVFWGLVRKDLYFSRLVMVGAFLTAAIGLGAQMLGGSFAAAILLFCAGAAPAAFLCIFLISAERQERSHLFALSLPISPSRYLLAKVLAVTTAFAVPWALLGLGICLLLAISPASAGLLPYFTVVWLFVLDQYCALLSVMVASQSAAVVTAAMVMFNVSPSLFFYYIARWANPEPSAVVVWTAYELRIVTIELGVAAACFALTLWCVLRQRDQT